MEHGVHWCQVWPALRRTLHVFVYPLRVDAAAARTADLADAHSMAEFTKAMDAYRGLGPARACHLSWRRILWHLPGNASGSGGLAGRLAAIVDRRLCRPTAGRTPGRAAVARPGAGAGRHLPGAGQQAGVWKFAVQRFWHGGTGQCTGRIAGYFIGHALPKTLLHQHAAAVGCSDSVPGSRHPAGPGGAVVRDPLHNVEHNLPADPGLARADSVNCRYPVTDGLDKEGGGFSRGKPLLSGASRDRATGVVAI